MSSHGVPPMLRRVSYLILSTMFACFIITSPRAIAQSQSSSNFASSSQGLIAENSDPTGALLAPAPASGGESQNGSYGSHDHNWTNHIAFEAGVGFNAPIGNDSPVITWGGNFTVGGGYKVAKRVSILTEYQFIDDKLPGALISDAGSQGGHAHIWSLTLDPVIDLFPAHKNDIYVTGGGGFYRKVTSFTDPEEVEECYYFCEVGTEDVVVSHFSSNQGGLNLGLGITHKLGGDENLKAFAEVRYLWLNTPGLGSPDGLGTTELLPVTVGVRW